MQLEQVDPIFNSPASGSVLILGNAPHVNSTGIFNNTLMGLMLTDPTAAGTSRTTAERPLRLTNPITITSGISSTAVKGLMHTDVRVTEGNNLLIAQVMRVPQDTGIRRTDVTTSGVVILDIFPDAGSAAEVFVPPVVINARVFPLFQGPFPAHDRRIFPVLPQFSTLTPGD
jgi:hypothetical protein